MKRLLILAILAVMLTVTTTLWAAPVLSIGDWKLTQAELDKSIQGKLFEVDNLRYKVRLEALQGILESRLLKMEAAKRGISVAALTKKEFKAPEVDEAKIERFRNINGDRIPPGFNIKEYLEEKLAEQTKLVFLSTLALKYKAKINIEEPPSPTFKVRGPLEPFRGGANAPVTIIEFSDYECPFCRRIQPTLFKLSDRYGDKLKFVYRHNPMPFHKKAPKASEAAMCAHDQGKFWEYHNLIFSKSSIGDLKKMASKLGLDGAKFNKCLDSSRHAGRVAADMAEAKRIGVSGTPTFFVNGIKLVGAQPLEEFVKVIEKILKK